MKGAGADRGGLTCGPGSSAAASRDAAAGPGPIFQIRKGSFVLRPPPIRIGGAVKLFYGECHSPSRTPAGSRRPSIARVCVNSIRIAGSSDPCDGIGILPREASPTTRLIRV